MNKQLFEQYAKLKEVERSTEEQMNALKPLILEELKAVEDVPIDLNGSVFSIMKRKKWAYSATLIEQEQLLKDNKDNEQANGIATFTEDRVLLFKKVIK